MSLFATSLSLVGTILMLFFAYQEIKYSKHLVYSSADYPFIIIQIGTLLLSFLAFVCLIRFIIGKYQRNVAVKIGMMICLLVSIYSLVLFLLDVLVCIFNHCCPLKISESSLKLL